MQECVAWVRWRGGWPGFINIRTSSGRGQRKGCWPGTVEDPRDTSKCRWTSPRPGPLGKTKGETCTRSPMTGIRAWIRRGRGGHGGPEGEEENGGCRCAARWRREARWEEIQQAIVWRERTGADPRERQLRIIHQSLLTHTHTHKKAWLIESKHQSAVLRWSPDPDGQRSTGNDALVGEPLINWQYLPTRNNRGAKGKRVDTHHPSVGALATEVSLPYGDVFVQVLSSAIFKNNEYVIKHQDSSGRLRQVYCQEQNQERWSSFSLLCCPASRLPEVRQSCKLI